MTGPWGEGFAVTYTSAAAVCMPIQPECTDAEYLAVLGEMGAQCVATNYRECTWDRVPCHGSAVTCSYSMCGFNVTSAAGRSALLPPGGGGVLGGLSWATAVCVALLALAVPGG